MKTKVWLKSVPSAELQNVLKSFDADVTEASEYEKGADLDIIFGSWKDRDVTHHNLKRDIVKNSKNVLVLETPLVYRGPVKEIMDDQWFRVGLNGFMRNAQYVPITPNRSIIKETPESIEWKTEKIGDYILIVLQLPGDASLDFIDVSKWAKDTATALRKQTDRDIVIRFPQLRREFDLEWTKDLKHIYFQDGQFTDKECTLDNAYATVTYSSGMGVESILRQRRTYIESKNGFYSKQSSLDQVLKTDYENFNDESDALRWYDFVRSTQWHFDEIKSGKCLNAFKSLINGDSK